MTNPRDAENGRSAPAAYPGPAARRLLIRALVFVGLATILVACELDLLPRAVGAGEIIVVGYPSTSLSKGDSATFTLSVNLPPGQYLLHFGVDPAGINATNEAAAGEASEPTDIVVAGDGTVSAKGEKLSGTEVDASDRLIADGEPVIGVARSWAVKVDVVDPYGPGLESYVNAVFPYRVQWTE